MKRKGNSGQVILIAVLAMALILLSTHAYISEVQMSTVDAGSDSLEDYVYAIELGSRNVVIGSLANVSQSGLNTILTTILEKWTSLVDNQSKFGKSSLNYTVDNTYPYSSGVWRFWGNSGFGVSSVSANFTLKLSDMEVDVNLFYSMNVTTTVLVQGTCRVVNGNEKQVSVTINVLNEGKPALAKQITLYYRVVDSWQAPNTSNNFVLTEYGNGTYGAYFQADIPSPNVEVSVHTTDRREIFVQANATCIEI